MLIATFIIQVEKFIKPMVTFIIRAEKFDKPVEKFDKPIAKCIIRVEKFDRPIEKTYRIINVLYRQTDIYIVFSASKITNRTKHFMRLVKIIERRYFIKTTTTIHKHWPAGNTRLSSLAG